MVLSIEQRRSAACVPQINDGFTDTVTRLPFVIVNDIRVANRAFLRPWITPTRTSIK